MTKRPHTVHLIDATPYVFRALFALPDTLTGPDGEPVSAVLGFANFLLRFLIDEQPTHVAAAFDESLSTSFRNDLYPDYKSSRPKAPPELAEQLLRCRELCEALGVLAPAHARFEADDLIASLCRPLASRGHRVVIVSPDKDLCQLVGPRVTLYDLARGVRLGPDGVVDKLGVRPEQVTDLLGLAGDPVDDIPGVPGVGPKTAVALLARFGDLEAALADLDAVADLPLRGAAALARRLAEHRELALLSKQLATVATDAPVPTTLAAVRWRGGDRERLPPLLASLGMERLADRVPRWQRRPARTRPAT